MEFTEIDKNYLHLQFWNRIFTKNGTDFQAFFEDIMRNAFKDFQKVRPYGNKGDGGNDGYIPTKGVYYQVYSPLNPKEKEADAARKLIKNFETLKNKWNTINEVKEYNFVYNDKGYGVTSEIFGGLAELGKSNKTIKFGVFLPQNLEDIFFTLSKDQLLNLGFNIDSTNSVEIVNKYLQMVEKELDREIPNNAYKSLEIMDTAIASIKDEMLNLEFDILKARTLHKQENIPLAINKYQKITKKYPNDPRPLLYLAEIALNSNNPEENRQLLEKAKTIDSKNELLRLEQLIRSYRLNEVIDLKTINPTEFPKNKRMCANFYRLYAGVYEENLLFDKALEFINESIKLNSNKFNSYDSKLSIFEGMVYEKGINDEERENRINRLIAELSAVEKLTSTWGELSKRSRAILYFKKFRIGTLQENLPKIEENAQKCFELIKECYFDRTMDSLLAEILTYVELPDKDFSILLEFLRDAKLSKDLEKRLVFQFILKDKLTDDGKTYFTKLNRSEIVSFINNIENKEYDKTIEFLKADHLFAIAIANTYKKDPQLRMKIIESLPNDGSVQKEKLLLLLSYDEGQIDNAYEYLKELDLSKLGYIEARQLLLVAQKKKAWDVVIKLLNVLIAHTEDKSRKLDFKLQLFTAHFNLEMYKDAAIIGESILDNPEETVVLNTENKENLLVQTIIAKTKRGELEPAMSLMEKHIKLLSSHESILGIKVDVYLRNRKANEALKAIVEGITLIKSPTPEQYGLLFLYFTEIDNLITKKTDTMETVTKDCFVKLNNRDLWYFVGNGEYLDATPIKPDDSLYKLFTNKNIGDQVLFQEKYRADASSATIELIMPIDRYIRWQSQHNAHKLTVEDRWKAMEIIDIPKTETGIDPKFLVKRLSDAKEATGKFFDMYTDKRLPLAFLAINEGSLPSAIGRIVTEQKGYINFSLGTLDEINEQKNIARRILSGEAFYLDGTSALILAETGLLKEVYKHVENIRTPQSVITLLLETSEKFVYSPGQKGHMTYAQGKVIFSEINKKKSNKIRKNFQQVISVLEQKPDNIIAISNANKSDKFAEQKVPPYLSDACVLAQKDKTLVLTDDPLYLEYNRIETGKTKPEYCSSFALIRTLYEQNKIPFSQYLAFFYYLTTYRYRFLPITFEDMETAIFGEGRLTKFEPTNIRLLNLPLTMSEEYGVPFTISFPLICRLIIKILIDDSKTSELLNKVVSEIINEYPTKVSKDRFSKMLIGMCVNIVKQNLITSELTNKKADYLIKLTSSTSSTKQDGNN